MENRAARESARPSERHLELGDPHPAAIASGRVPGPTIEVVVEPGDVAGQHQPRGELQIGGEHEVPGLADPEIAAAVDHAAMGERGPSPNKPTRALEPPRNDSFASVRRDPPAASYGNP